MKRFTNLGLAAVLSLTANIAVAEEKPTLTVYTYDAFAAEWGPAPAIKTAFEAECNCTLEFVAADSSIGILRKLQLEGDSTEADVALGLDTNLTAEAGATGLFMEHGADLSSLELPIAWEDTTFLPFDYGYFSFVYNSEAVANPPKSFEELAAMDDDFKIVIQDPRSSTPGLGLMLWVKALYGDEAPAIWSKIAPKILTVTKGWSDAYGIFLKGEAEMVLSYTTSPAYHLIAEEDARFKSAGFDEGHYMQVEVASIVQSTDQPVLAKDFMQFILEAGFQGAIPTGNWMYPATGAAGDLPAGYETMHVPSKALLLSGEDVNANRRAWTEEFLEAIGQ
jgi:thiamine transport system substrate-binding protein